MNRGHFWRYVKEERGDGTEVGEPGVTVYIRCEECGTSPAIYVRPDRYGLTGLTDGDIEEHLQYLEELKGRPQDCLSLSVEAVLES